LPGQPYRGHYASRIEEIGLFPLGVVLLPTERIPLHIFEPRYRELIGECLETGGQFGLLLADDDGVREVGTRATVTDVLQRFEDGRLNIVIEGGERFRVVELTEGRSFQTAEVEPVLDEEGAPEPAEVERALGLVRRLAELAGADADELEVTSDIPSFELAGHVAFEADVKQELLELRSEPDRLARLAVLLEDAAKSLEERQATAKIAQTNGRVGSRPR
jgi:Lon protease-like protein